MQRGHKNCYLLLVLLATVLTTESSVPPARQAAVTARCTMQHPLQVRLLACAMRSIPLLITSAAAIMISVSNCQCTMSFSCVVTYCHALISQGQWAQVCGQDTRCPCVVRN